MDNNTTKNKEKKHKGNSFLKAAMILMLIGMTISGSVMIFDWSFHSHEDFRWITPGDVYFTVIYVLLMVFQIWVIGMIINALSTSIELPYARKLRRTIIICMILNILSLLYCLVDFGTDTVQGYFTMGQLMLVFQPPGVITKCIALIGANRLIKELDRVHQREQL